MGRLLHRKENQDRCLRLKDAFAAQIADDMSWVEEGFGAKGKCKQTLAAVKTYIHGTDDTGLARQFRNTLDDIFNNWASKENKKGDGPFYLYVAGYTHFFNSDTDDCDKWTFMPFPYSIHELPLLVKGLRKEINDLIEDFLTVHRQVISCSYQPPKDMFVKYVSSTEGFQGHRFCERGSSFEDQWYNNDVGFWNLQYFDKAGQAVVGQTVDTPNDVKFMLLPQEAIDSLEANPDVQPFGSGSGNDISKGWQLRPFHPKVLGHQAMKDAVIRQLKADKVPGVRF